MSQKKMRIGMSLRGHGYHLAAWGCDRSTPKELRRLLPTLSTLRYIYLGGWHGFRSQVPLMNVLPDTT